MARVLGNDACQATIEHRLNTIMATNKARVSNRHLKLLAATMCFRGSVKPMTFSGICDEDTPVMKMAAFEKVMDSFVTGAAHGKHDNVRTMTESIAWKTKLRCGTGMVEVFATEPGERGHCEQTPAQLISHQRQLATRTVKRVYKWPGLLETYLQPREIPSSPPLPPSPVAKCTKKRKRESSHNAPKHQKKETKEKTQTQKETQAQKNKTTPKQPTPTKTNYSAPPPTDQTCAYASNGIPWQKIGLFSPIISKRTPNKTTNITQL